MPVRRRLLPLLILAGLSALGGAGYFAWRSMRAGAPSEGELPGAEVNLYYARSALVVEGDAADPIAEVRITRDGKFLPSDESWVRPDGGRAVVFFDVESGPVEVAVQTAHRKIRRTLSPGASLAGVLLRQIELTLPDGYRSRAVPETSTAFSPDNRWLAIGSFSGELKLLPVAGGGAGGARINRRIPLGFVKALAFTKNGPESDRFLVAGEQSPDGFVHGFDAASGKERWKFRLADELGSSTPDPKDTYGVYSYPGVYRILPLRGGDVLLLGLHSWRPAAGVKKARSRVYRMNAATGKVRWRYPAGAPLPRNIRWISASADGKRICCVENIPGAGFVGTKEASLDLVVLDGESGAETGRFHILPLKPVFQNTFFNQALSMAPDGSGVLLGGGDGRLFALDCKDGRPRLRWEYHLGTPIRAGTARVYCPLGWSAAGREAFYVAVDRNFQPWGQAVTSSAPPHLHPEASTVQAFDARAPQAKRLWRYDAPGQPQGLWLSPDQRWLAFAYQKPAGTDASGKPTPADYGLAMLDLKRSGSGARKLAFLYATEGPLSFRAAFSPNSRYLALTEGPRPGKDRRSLTRTYRVLILH